MYLKVQCTELPPHQIDRIKCASAIKSVKFWTFQTQFRDEEQIILVVLSGEHKMRTGRSFLN